MRVCVVVVITGCWEGCPTRCVLRSGYREGDVKKVQGMCERNGVPGSGDVYSLTCLCSQVALAQLGGDYGR